MWKFVLPVTRFLPGNKSWWIPLDGLTDSTNVMARMQTRLLPSSLYELMKNAGRLRLSCILYFPLLMARPSELAVGGQAVIEGVMMRGKAGYAIAVRRPDGKIVIKEEKKIPWHTKYKWLGFPLIRGVSVLLEAMVVGFKALEYSANVAMDENPGEKEEEIPTLSRGHMILTFFVSFLFGIGLFVVLPNLVTQFLTYNEAGTPVLFHIIAGIIRMGIFLLYIVLISMFKDIKRVFEYHGAEHKTIHAYEAENELTVENVKQHSRFHPRCGTSFILTVMIVSIFVFALVTGVIVQFWPGFVAYPVWLQKLILIPVHILAMMPVAGLSYEVNRKCAKTMDSPVTKAIITPGLWFQRLTTREPDGSQMEVGITSLKKTLELGDV